ncbi:MAG: amino acid ABC transporter permease [Treponema sp.]|jgi:L-cystine transport system permease protein|nr:amino acid ABC transporter permease [Treponema sp.]
MEKPFYPEFIFTVIPRLLPFLGITSGILLGTILVGLPAGFLLAKAELGKNTALRRISGGIIEAFRCTPSIVMLFIMFYGLPKLFLAVSGIDINDWPKAFFVTTALGLLFAASAAEIMRSAYQAVDRGQYEAAVTAGLTAFQAFYRIVLPQAFVVALPNLGNSFIALLKEGSLAYTIGLIDIMGEGNLIIQRNYGAYALETYIALSVIYWTLTILMEQGFRRLESHYSKGFRLR